MLPDPLQGWRKQFHIGQANSSSMDTDTCVEVGLYLQDLENLMYKSYCAKHNQHAKHANSRGVWGHYPQEIFEKYVF